MGAKVLRVSLGEFGTVRVKCKGKIQREGKPELDCPMVYEVAIDQLGNAFPNDQCPRCNQSYWNKSAMTNPLASLSAAVQGLKSINKQLEIEFDLSLKN
jgi:hypothetical protein